MRTEGEFRALVSLLADEQEGVARTAWDALLESGRDAVPFLEAAFNANDPLLRGRARTLLEEMRFQEVEERWVRFSGQGNEAMDLEEGWLLLSALSGADVRERAVTSFLDAVSGTVRAHVPSAGGLQALNETIFDNLGFRGGDLDRPEHHYLPSVLERRRGLPIALAGVYILVGQRAGLPVYGVAMPDHFLALYQMADRPFYVDCFNRGQTYGYDDLRSVLSRRGVASPERLLAPCNTRLILYRMLNNLERLYSVGLHERLAERVRRWRELLVVKGNR